MNNKELKQKCYRLEQKINNIFCRPKFIRLRRESDGNTWYYHSGTRIFIPVQQNYINQLYSFDKKPEKSFIHTKSGRIHCGYLGETEALQILPDLPKSTMPKPYRDLALANQCHNKKIFLEETIEFDFRNRKEYLIQNKVYDDKSKKICTLQKNEQGTILEIYRLHDDYSNYKRQTSWEYDIYMWAKIGLIPWELYKPGEDAWNIMKFLIDDFKQIDFEDVMFSSLNEIDISYPFKMNIEKTGEKEEMDANKRGSNDMPIRKVKKIEPIVMNSNNLNTILKESKTNENKIQQLLDCDKNRCRLEAYDKGILYDITRGHWELFDLQEKIKNDADNVYAEMVSRDPRLDIKQGVVGIDFGTKSTVVVRQDSTNRIVPIRIGTGNLSREVKEEDFENPTVIEFTNVKQFLDDYQKEKGRPHTSCNDIFISYDAYESFQNCKPDDFYAYFHEIKQWANQEKGSVPIRDKQKKEYDLSRNTDIQYKNINPVELYAYYVGLYINNMRNGIYLKYLMTFPVGYSKETRAFIVDSFREGIRKSFPSAILNDEEYMKQFQVELGISEPAAYAVTVLEQSHLDPKDETERFMYGIFDFGGGTTDFDFGIWRGATEEEYEKEAYDYVLECFGADSDVTLGGENILELLAYEVFRKNLDVFRKHKITFTLPIGETAFIGSETLLVNSQIAKRNMTILKEKLRPLWHQEQGWKKKYELDSENKEDEKEGIIVLLYNMNGEPVPQCVLEFSSENLVELIKNRIQKGIDRFFQCLGKTFLYEEQAKKEENKVYLFLAGNSSKSVFVKELFQKKIAEYHEKFKEMTETAGNSYFTLIDPLTGESENNENYKPNAKTGVAYGLLKSRAGSSIKIVKNYENDASQQSRFRYYLGKERRHHFDCKLSPVEVEYGRWIPFQGAAKAVIRIYYTSNPMADSKTEQIVIDDIPYKEIHVSEKEDAYLYIRTIEPDSIEYVVATEVKDISDSEIQKCVFN